MKTGVLFILALVLFLSGVFAQNIIRPTNSSGSFFPIFLSNESIYAQAQNLQCNAQQGGGAILYTHSAQVSNPPVFLWIVPDTDIAAVQNLNLSTARVAGPLAVDVDPAGNIVPASPVLWPAPTTPSLYDLVLTFQSDEKFNPNRQMTILDPAGQPQQVRCNDIIFMQGATPSPGVIITDPPCGGTATLALSPSTTSPGTQVTATISGLSYCSGKTIYIRQGSCAGTSPLLNSTPASSSTGATITFNSQPIAGSFNIYACIDADASGAWAQGEPSDSKTLTVAACTGTLSLSMPNSTQPGSSVAVSVGGLTNCDNKNAHLVQGTDCSLQAVPGCNAITISNNAGSCSFSAPSAGSYQYTACLDKNFNGNYNDAGESAQKPLQVTAAATCGASSCGQCSTQSTCENVGCSWTGSACAAPSCDASHLALCDTSASCSTAGGNWCNNACQASACAGSCSSNNLGACSSQASCSTAGGYWCDGQCQDTPCTQQCSPSNCDACGARTDCENSECYWYGSSCHATPQPSCTGTPTVNASKTTIKPGETATLTVSGLGAGCDGKTILITNASCSGTQLASCDLDGGSCSAQVLFAKTGTYSLKACVDKNSDGAFTSSGEATTIVLAVQKTAKTTPPAGDEGGLPSWMLYVIIIIVIIVMVLAVVLLLLRRKRAQPVVLAPQPPM